MTTVRYLGDSVFAFEHEGKTAPVNPWLTGNPKAAIITDEVAADVILPTAHIDHIGDTVAIGKRTGAPVVAILEIAAELDDERVQTMGPNIGGGVDLGWVSVKLTPAWHTSTTPKGTVNTPAGLLIEIGGNRIYDLGDTGLFSDLAIPRQSGHIDLAIMPIGGGFCDGSPPSRPPRLPLCQVER
jgi:L-ascorbate metabolism protein UlaG (beta-lactamase superfamily)